MKVIAFDPGSEHVGVAEVAFSMDHEPQLLDAFTQEVFGLEDKALKKFWEWLAHIYFADQNPKTTVIVIEVYTPRPTRQFATMYGHKTTAVLYIIKLAALIHGLTVHVALPQLRKVCTLEKAAILYLDSFSDRPLTQHVIDAIQHAIAYTIYYDKLQK